MRLKDKEMENSSKERNSSKKRKDTARPLEWFLSEEDKDMALTDCLSPLYSRRWRKNNFL